MNAVLVKRGNRATLNLSEPGVLSDYARRLDPHEVLDGVPVSSYADGVHKLQHHHEPAPVVQTADAPPPRSATDDTVVYEKGLVTAYFDDTGRSAHPSMATWCKVWSAGGVMKVISLKGPERGAPTHG